MKPIRIQRKRTKGYDMLAVSRAANSFECVSVTQPGRWGNPYDLAIRQGAVEWRSFAVPRKTYVVRSR